MGLRNKVAQGELVKIDETLLPKWLLKLALRIGGLQKGNVYTLTIILPDEAADKACWTVTPLGKIEGEEQR